MAPTGPKPEFRTASRDALVFWAIGALVLGILVVAQILLLTFGGILFGTTLRGAAEWFARRTRLGIHESLAACIALLAALTAMAVLWVVPRIAEQSGELWMHVVYVGVLYIGIHLADGYLLSPPLQRRAVRTPSLLVLASQLVCGALWGIVGLTFATPLVASVRIAVDRLYVDAEQH